MVIRNHEVNIMIRVERFYMKANYQYMNEHEMARYHRDSRWLDPDDIPF